MLREERIAQILEELKTHRRLSTTSLMAQFEVTEGTIRRDLNELQSKGLLKKVHGGAIPVVSDPPGLSGRMKTASARKIRLAKKAVQFIQDGQVLIIDGGSSNLALIQELPKDIRLTIFTNSIPAASLLIAFANIDVHLLGGKVLPSSEVTLDIGTFQQAEKIRADRVFLGVRSVHPDIGIATLSGDEARLKRAFCDRSDQVIVMATNEKLFTSDYFKIGPVSLVDIFILENDADAEIVKSLSARDIQVVQ